MSITIIIIVITVGVSLLGFRNKELLSRLMFSPYMIYHHKQYYRFVSHAFIHDPTNLFHLFFS